MVTSKLNFHSFVLNNSNFTVQFEITRFEVLAVVLMIHVFLNVMLCHQVFHMFWSTVMPLSSGSSSQRTHNIKYWKTHMLEILALDMTWRCWISCSLYFKGTCHLLLQGIKVHEEGIHGPESPKDESDTFLYHGKPFPKGHIICQETWNFFSKRLIGTKKKNYQDNVSVPYEVIWMTVLHCRIFIFLLS